MIGKLAHHTRMNWQALTDGELPDSDLWLLSLFDRFSGASQAAHARRQGLVIRALMPVFMLIALAVRVPVLRALHVALGVRFIPPVAVPPRLPAAGVMLTPRLLPVPVAVRRG